MATQTSSAKTQVKDELYWADMVSKTKTGSLKVYVGFFYTHGRTSQTFVDRVLSSFPEAKIVDHGSQWKPFKGGGTVKTSSHFWVEFTL